MPIPRAWTRPKLARRAIEEAFPNRPIDDTLQGSWESAHLGIFKFLLEVLSNVDEQILFATFTPEQGLRWRRNLAAIQAAVRTSQNAGGVKLPFAHVVEMYRLLEGCPEEIVPKAEPRLTFIVDPKLKKSIARDIDSLDVFFRDEEWKGATVIGGSVVEALLVDRLLDPVNATKAQAAESAHVTAKDKGWSRVEAIEAWKLWKLIAVANEIGLIEDVVAKVCEGARDFRNLIHPTKERAESPCDRGTALATLAAVENLVATFNGTR